MSDAWTPRQVERLLVSAEHIAAAARYFRNEDIRRIRAPEAKTDDSEASELRGALLAVLVQLDEWVQTPVSFDPDDLLRLVHTLRSKVAEGGESQ